MSWTKLPPLPGRPNPCANCPPIEARLPLVARVVVGFGSASVTKDDECIYDDPGADWEDAPKVRHFEKLARKDPDHDWRVTYFGPLHGETYQRQGPGRWVLVEKNEGFA